MSTVKRTTYLNLLILVTLGFLFFDCIVGITAAQGIDLEHSIQEANQKLERAEQLAKLCHWELELDTNVMTFSPNATLVLGLASESIDHSELEKMLAPDSFEIRKLALADLITGAGIYNLDLQLRRADGTRLDIHSVATYDRETHTVFGTFLDITDYKTLERELVATKKRDGFIALFAMLLQSAIIIALVINVRENKEARDRLESDAARNESMLRIFHSEADSIEKLMKIVLSELMNLLDASDGCLCLYDAEDEEFNLRVYSSSAGREFFQRIDHLKRRAVQTQKFVCDSRFIDAEMRCSLLVPIRRMGKIVALVGLASSSTTYSADDAQLISVLMASAWGMMDRRHSRFLLGAERTRLKTTLLSVGEGVITTDSSGQVEMINPMGERLTGWSAEHAIGESIVNVFPIAGDAPLHPVNKVLASGEAQPLVRKITLPGKNDLLSLLKGSIAPILDRKGKITGTVFVFRDVTEERRRQKEVEYLSYHDPLTSLYNRRFFQEHLQRLDSEGKLPISIILGDVKGLRLINDAFGHLVGDELLKRVALVLQENCRAQDVIARWGGDEFVIVLPGMGEHEAIGLTKRLEQAFLGERIESMAVTVAFGWGTKAQVTDNILTTFKMAEERMYRAKLSRAPLISNETILALMGALYEKSEREEQHSRRVSELCCNLARALGLTANKQEEMGIAGLFHDIGKIAIEGEILNKPGRLDGNEWLEMKGHSERGYRILNAVPGMALIAEAVLYHHERWDGTGYPQGLRDEEIPLMARIIAVADAYDAMVSVRPYRQPLTPQQARDELHRCAGTQFDPAVVNAFLTLEKLEETLA